MAESSFQQLSSQISAHQSQSQECQQLLQNLYSGVEHCCGLMATAPGPSETALVPVPDCRVRTQDSPLPDLATVEQLLAQLQQVSIFHQNQCRKLTSVSQQLEANLADHARAIVALQAATQNQDYPGCAKHAHLEDRTSPAELLQLAESVAAASASQAGWLTQSQSQIQHLHELLSQAQARTDAAESEVTACKEQLAVVSYAAQSAQTSLQQVIRQHCLRHAQALPINNNVLLLSTEFHCWTLLVHTVCHFSSSVVN